MSIDSRCPDCGMPDGVIHLCPGGKGFADSKSDLSTAENRCSDCGVPTYGIPHECHAAPKPKPPLGAMPRWRWLELRLEEVYAAFYRSEFQVERRKFLREIIHAAEELLKIEVDGDRP